MSNDMICNIEEGKLKINLKIEIGRVSLSQLKIAELFEAMKNETKCE